MKTAAADAGAAVAPTAGGAAASYGGTYTLAPGTIYINAGKDYAHVKQAKDDPAKHVGAGTLSIAVAADGKVSGSVESGPASPATIDGALVDGEIRGNVRRTTTSDDGLTGTLVGKITGASGAGTMTLADANASIVRDGPITLTRK
jgi:hypothetical protein